ncbi:FAD binding domain-containing protein [Bacillus sp. ISL-18]|uniref:FAD binding domain-containing protein n=1 Tax=Bacillus sp. ISL-18 TaxID=2819118 RepID=UPI001BE82087|nr:FAD binding domain-containing protein [Bacillus sp. ISL-18]MBT2654878.1 FAD binding domain-containing protein [Bacillus sp. ISL-18]
MIRQGAAMLNSPEVWLPDDLSAAWKLKQQFRGESCFIAGGTLMQTQWQKGADCPRHLISLEKIKEMQVCENAKYSGEAGIRIGALTTLAACKEHPSLLKQFPLLEEAVRNVAAPAIRNRATIGGNIAGRFGDLTPALLALDTTLSLYDGSKLLFKPLSDWIREGTASNDFILTAIYVHDNLKLDKKSFFYKKLGFREAFTPSIVTISGCCQLGEQNEVKYIRLAAGGGTTPYQRLTECERLAAGLTLTNDLLKKLFQGIKEEFNAATDVFTTSAYKKTVAANMMVSKIASFAG